MKIDFVMIKNGFLLLLGSPAAAQRLPIRKAYLLAMLLLGF